MIKNKFLLAMLLLSTYVFSQESEFSGKVEYKMYLNFNDLIEYKSQLLFNNSSSMFLYKEALLDDSSNEEISGEDFEYGNAIRLRLRDTITNQIVVKKLKDSLYEKHKDFVEKNLYYSIEKIPVIKWELTNEKKRINNIECNLAKATFRGRIFSAWYAPSIASSFGPWKLNGLPGLIVEAYDDYKEVLFYLEQIKLPAKGSTFVLNKRLKIISFEDHIKKMNVMSTELERKISSRVGRGINITVKAKINRIELNYN